MRVAFFILEHQLNKSALDAGIFSHPPGMFLSAVQSRFAWIPAEGMRE